MLQVRDVLSSVGKVKALELLQQGGRFSGTVACEYAEPGLTERALSAIPGMKVCLGPLPLWGCAACPRNLLLQLRGCLISSCLLQHLPQDVAKAPWAGVRCMLKRKCGLHSVTQAPALAQYLSVLLPHCWCTEFGPGSFQLLCAGGRTAAQRAAQHSSASSSCSGTYLPCLAGLQLSTGKDCLCVLKAQRVSATA